MSKELDELRKVILSLLLARKGATPVPVLDRDYYDMEKKRIPYRQFGYTDLVGFLQSMPEHFIVEQYNGGHYVRGIASEKSKHVSSLVARQKISQKTRPNPSSFHLRQPYNRRMQNMKPQQVKIAPDKLFLLMQHIKNNPSGVSLQNAVVFVQQMVPFINISTQELRAQLHELSHQLFLDGNMIYPVWSKDLRNAARQQPLMEEPQSRDKSPNDSESPPTTQTVFAAGQEDFDDIQYLSDENDFVSANCANNYQRHAETSNQFATNLAQYANCEQTDLFNYNKDNNTEVNEDFATMNSNTEIKTAECFDLSQMINDRTKSRLEELMRKYPDGIWCADLPNIYFHEYKVRLNYNQLGFASVREFTSYLPKIFYMTQVNKTDDFRLYSADKRPVVPKTEPVDIVQTSNNRYEHSTMQAQCSNNNDDDAPIPSEVSPTITQHFAPNDVINYNDNVEKISVTELKHGRQYLEVYVIEVFHPNFFWVHLRENKKRFNKMMDELSEFYDCNRSTYTIAKVALKKEMHCACVYMSRWHRGIIKSVKPDYRVTIFFYDYGTLKTYAPEDVYYLHKKFSYLPAQAIPCGLYNVKPIVGDRWKKSVIDQFVDKIADHLLAATIISIDPTYNSMIVILTDTSEEEDVHINDWLVKERLAQVGKTADAVDMASIMKYVVNNLNQLPTYCFAEENLMPDNCYKATSTEEKYEVPLIASGPTLLHYDNHHHQQQSVRPPPGFPPLGEQCVSSSLPTKSFYNDYSFTNTSNVKTSVGSDSETNPFLVDQGFIPSDIAKEMYMLIWNDNKSLQIKVIDILYDLLECSSLSFKDQVQLNKILKIIEKVLLEQKNDRSTVVKTSSTSNPVNETTLNDVGCAQKASYNLNNETFAKQDLNTDTFSISNPFSMNDDDRSQNNVTFSTYVSDSFASKTNWNQSDEFNPHMQMPPSATTNPAPSVINHISPANTFLPNTNQNDNNVPVTVSPAVPAKTNFNNFSEYLDGVNTQFANLLKDTNPFKFSMTNGMQESATNGIQVPETQNERTSHNYDADITSYPSARNSQSYASKTETANTYMRSNCFTPVTENYSSKFVYESAPIMYNTQKKQTDTRQNTCNNLNNIQSTQSLEQDKKPSQPDTSYTHKMTNHIKRDKLQVDENYVTRPSTCYRQGSQPIINGKPIYYQQNNNANNMRPVSSQFWNQIETSEQWVNSKFQNSVPLSNLGENTAFGTPTTLFQDCNSDKKSTPLEINEATDLNYIFKFKDCHDKKKSMDVTSWNNIEKGCVQKDAISNTNSFVFQKIDSVKGVTFIFNIEQDGWILTYEFVEAFTNLKLQSRLLAILEAMNIKVIFKEIQRSDYPLQFSQLDRYPLNVPRDSEKRIISINLISLQSALALLHKLKIVSREEIENAFKKNEFLDGSILPMLWILIVAYRDLKRRIELCSYYI